MPSLCKVLGLGQKGKREGERKGERKGGREGRGKEGGSWASKMA